MKFLIELAVSVALFVVIFGLVASIVFLAGNEQSPKTKDVIAKRAWRIM